MTSWEFINEWLTLYQCPVESFDASACNLSLVLNLNTLTQLVDSISITWQFYFEALSAIRHSLEI